MTRNPTRTVAVAPERSGALLLGLMLATSLVAGGAGADDTEVFFGQADPERSVRPNVLFVLDTSGSMNWGEVDGYAPGEGKPSRLAVLKNAMNEVLDSSSEVNVGLMRMNGFDGGGAVVFPITPIDQDICADGGCDELRASSKVSAQADNAEQHLSDGELSTNGRILSLGKQFGNDGESQAVGLRFPDLDIPTNATIVSAELDLTSREDRSGDVSLTVRAESDDDNDADPYVHGDDDAVTERDVIENLQVDWTIDEDWAKDERYSVDVTDLVSNVTSDAQWCGGQALGLIVAAADGNTGNRDAYTFRSSQDNAPRLRVTYKLQASPLAVFQPNRGCQIQSTSAKPGTPDDDVIQLDNGGGVYANYYQEIPYVTNGSYKDQGGFRFSSLAVPKNADVVDAHIEFTHRVSSGGDVRFGIRAQKHNDAPPYVSSRYNLTGSRSYTDEVVWNITRNAIAGRTERTPDLGGLVDAVTSRGGWTSGNAIAFKIAGSDNDQRRRRTFMAYNEDPTRAARLYVRYKSTVSFASSNPTLIARDAMKSELANLKAESGTPVVDALFEASKYMLGQPVVSGLQRGVNPAYRYHRVSHPDSWTGGVLEVPEDCTADDPNSWACTNETVSGNPVYRPQLTQSCQANSIVVLTDGAPSGTVDKTGIEALIGSACDPTKTDETGRCAADLASWLVNNDLNPNVAGEQKIRTHTVNLNLVPDPAVDDDSDVAKQVRASNALRREFLSSVARQGDGKTFEATDTASLVDAFRTILSSVESIDTAFTAPGATVNQYNRLTHRDDIYFAVFRPDDTPRWKGNLKKYKVGREKDEDDKDIATTEIEIRDSDQAPAVDVDTGFFDKQAKSFWTPQDNGGVSVTPVDGDQVGMGGMTGRMENASTRNLYTYLGEPSEIPETGVELDSGTAHAFSEDNAGITDTMLELELVSNLQPSERPAYRTKLLKWARGVDVQDEDLDGDTADGRRYVGDPMHSRPVILNYAGDDSIIYLTTNEGFLHAIDTDDGAEKWAFMPKHLFGNINTLYENEASVKHPYGLDGQVSVWRNDPNQNYVVDANERAMLFAGMRRGGRNYYGFDVTDFGDPKLTWTIEGGKADTDFEELGESWSRATPARIKIAGDVKDVLIFGGGYDAERQDPDYDKDAARKQPKDEMGRALFIVDALTGEKLWSVGHKDATNVDRKFDDMKYSLPADVRVVDVDLDGLADQLYTADMGGQVWRFDVKSDHSTGALLQGGVIADLNGNDKQDHRRFYNEPDVAVIEKDGNRFMSVSIGSGWRAHPLDEIVQDRFYVIKSPFVRVRPGEKEYGRKKNGDDDKWRPIKEKDLVDVAKAEGIPKANDYGWFLDFSTTGEKVLGRSVTFDDSVLFSTYVPQATAASRPCEPSLGGGRAYVLSVVNGYPTRNISSRDNSTDFATQDEPDDKIDVADRSKNLMHGGIPPEPAILITEDGTPLVVFGPEKLETGFDNGTKRTFWADRGAAEVQGRPEPVVVTEENR